MATLHELAESNGWRKVIYHKISSENEFEGFIRASDLESLFYSNFTGLFLLQVLPVSQDEQPSFFPERPEILHERELIDERI